MQKSVLICEDDEGIVDVATIVLQEKGYIVESTMNGSEILAKIKKNRPDLILLDLWMPEMTGEEVASILQSQTETKDIPIIIVSASKDIKKIASASQVTDYLPKPFDIIDLENIVEKYIN
ncbi:MAG: response regulator [Patescibacteria group bacterium]